jgi:hypothetical protein
MSTNIADVTFGGEDVNDTVREIEVWQTVQNPVARWQILCNNPNNYHTDAWHANTVMTLKVNGVDFISGLFDVGKRVYEHSSKAKWRPMFLATGRDFMKDLDNFTIDTSIAVKHKQINDLIPECLTEAGANITFNNPTILPAPFESNPLVLFDSKERIQLNRGIMQILNDAGFEAYGDLDVLTAFPFGTQESGITLYALEDDDRNNIIGDVELTEFDGNEMHNVTIVKGGKLEDGFTDLNAADWQPKGGATFEDAIYDDGDVTLEDFQGTSPQPPFMGASAIKCVNNSGQKWIGCDLTFPKYNILYLDFHRIWLDNLKFHLLWYQSYNPGASAIEILLEDTNYVFIRYAGGSDWLKGNKLSAGNYLAVPPEVVSANGRWREYNVAIGPGSMDKWLNVQYSAGDRSTFNWKIRRILIVSYFENMVQYHMLDALKAPIQQYAVTNLSSGMDYTAQRIYNRTDIRYQSELQAHADTLCAKRKVAVKALKLTARGSAGLISGTWKWKPGLTFNLALPGETTVWRFVNLHHKIARNVDNTGETHIVEIDAIPYDQPYDIERFTYMQQGGNSSARQLHDRVKVIETALPQALQFTG